jgi:hypothetical protein
VFLACALLAVAPAAAASLYVSPTGSNTSNDCKTQASPCATIQYAVDQAVTLDDTISVGPGTYNECVNASGTALDFVASAFDTEIPHSNELTVIDGTGVCGGRVCSIDPATACVKEADCAGTCALDTGHCAIATDTVCTADADCTETDDSCVLDAGTCTNNAEAACAEDTDCDSTCDSLDVVVGPVVQLGYRSSLKGFTVKNGGESGVVLLGTGTIENNVIKDSLSSFSGGGVRVELEIFSGRAVDQPPTECFGQAAFECGSDTDCSACSDDSTVQCTSDADCVGTCDNTLGPCLFMTNTQILDNQIQNNQSYYGAGMVVDAGGLAPFAGARVFVTGNTFQGNDAAEDGGGIYLRMAPYGKTTVEADDNQILDNSADNRGAGLYAFSMAVGDGLSSIAITNNTITGNSASNDGGGAFAGLYTGYYYYYYSGSGDNRVDIKDNTVQGNTAEDDGGGVAVWSYDHDYNSTNTVNIEGNTISENEAGWLSGGVDAYFEVDDYAGKANGDPSSYVITTNSITGNTAAYAGGGMTQELYWDYGNPNTTFIATKNTIDGNTADAFGGGVALLAYTYGYDSTVGFDHNLVMNNVATNEDGNAAGGGLFVYLGNWNNDLFVNVDFCTFLANSADLGGGAVEVESDYQGDGEALTLNGRNSIAVDNVGYAIAGPAPGRGNDTWVQYGGSSTGLEINVAFSDTFNNSAGIFERSLNGYINSEENLTVDPMLDANGVPDVCSLTIDAGDPDAVYTEECQAIDPDTGPYYHCANGGRANQGHLGGTVDATRTLPDITGDRWVTGADLLELSTAFGAASGDRFISTADFDHTDLIDGADLAILEADYGQYCLAGGGN